MGNGPGATIKRHLDLGRYGCDVTTDHVTVIDKVTRGVWELERHELGARSRRSVSHRYYLSIMGLSVFSLFIGLVFIVQILDLSEGQLTLLASGALLLMASPFIVRLLVSGFPVILIYVGLCGLFSVLVGGWFHVPMLGMDGVFYMAGILPYLGSRLFASVWAENNLVLESGDGRVELKVTDTGLRRLHRALGNGEEG
jgi:hypothetical protein